MAIFFFYFEGHKHCINYFSGENDLVFMKVSSSRVVTKGKWSWSLSRYHTNLPGRTEENRKTPPGEPVSGPRFQSRVFQIQSCIIQGVAMKFRLRF